MRDGEQRAVDMVDESVADRSPSFVRRERMAVILETATMIGHDLRNPLQAIVSTIYLLKRRLDSVPPEHKRILKDLGVNEMLQTIENQVGYMDKIVSDLQDYARPVKLEIVETNLTDLVTDTLSPITIPENIEISLELRDLWLNLDPALMKRVITNLVTNALQAMPKGGRLTFTSSESKKAVSVSLRDTGIGIPEQNLDKLFQPLFTTKCKGQGFGLSVCKRLVEAHNGKIMVESKEEEGSTFTIRIPLTMT